MHTICDHCGSRVKVDEALEHDDEVRQKIFLFCTFSCLESHLLKDVATFPTALRQITERLNQARQLA